MSNNNFTENILSNPHYLDLKDGKYIGKKKIQKISISTLFLIIISIVPLSFIYTIGTGFTIGGFNYVFSVVLSLSFKNLQAFLYNLIIGTLGLFLIVIGFYLTSLLIRLVRK